MAVAAAVLVLAVLGTAVGGPWRLHPRPWLGTATPPSLPPITLPQSSGFPSAPARTGPARTVDLSWLVTVGIVIGALAVAVLLWWLWRRYRSSAVERRTARELGAVVVLPAEPELPVLRRGVAAAQRHLDEIADPNNAIVAAWLALEAAAESSGVGRDPAETPTEFTVDVLRRTAADPQATRRLLGLYHRARFSAAGVTRADVTTAGDCLAELARSWTALTDDAVSVAVARGVGDSTTTTTAGADSRPSGDR